MTAPDGRARMPPRRNRTKTYGHFIDGAYVDPVKGNTIDSYNPYTGEV
jgi:hypothetical protein